MGHPGACATPSEKQIPCGNDNQKNQGGDLAGHRLLYLYYFYLFCLLSTVCLS
jgi:hypothetical protein